MLLQVIFLLVSAATLGAALLVVTSRNLFHSALFLTASFFGIAALYILLEAEFLAVVQVLIYVGAIATLIVFAIMLSRGGLRDVASPMNDQWLLVAIGALALFAVLTALIQQIVWPVTEAKPAADILAGLGRAFMGPYVIPFEVASVLLVVALIGAILIAREKE
ncbi:MAG: NADH-quinone oxidoreductase subunit J [Anaerolineae bacterium]|nr:NADH-quinone oxidoreductase subunit J [Anaerolineae bacterium]MDW8099474.1 NADH-quinone oxidoreductase subunit J [Anaerolineae bacterium]